MNVTLKIMGILCLAAPFLNAQDQVRFQDIATQVESDLGFELDFSATFRPHDRFTWKTEIGYLIPGKAWEGGTNGFATKSPFALMTKAAINF